jgi:hypothetical protein
MGRPCHPIIFNEGLSEEIVRRVRSGVTLERAAEEVGVTSRAVTTRSAGSLRQTASSGSAGSWVCTICALAYGGSGPREARTARVCRALCRTRTGDPFLTMAVRLGGAVSCRRPKRLHRRESRTRQQSAGDSRVRHPPLPTRYPWQSQRYVRSADRSALTPRFKQRAETRPQSHRRVPASLREQATRSRLDQGFSSTSGGQRTRPLSKRPIGESRRTVAARSSSSTIVPSRPAR